MKKLTFTLSSVLLVCAVLFISCQKNNSSTTTKTPTTGGTTAANSLVVDGTSNTVATNTNTAGNTFYTLSNSTGITSGGYPTISLYFLGTSAPAAGTYTASNNPPTSGMCRPLFSPASSIIWTVITCHMTVTSGTSRNVSFSGATFTDGTSTHTVSANLPF